MAELTKIKSLARAHTEKAIEVLGGIMAATQSPESARVAAATALLDRGWGKPAQAIAGPDGESPPKLEISWQTKKPDEPSES